MPQTQGIHSLFEDKKIRIVLKCVVVALLLVLAVLTMTFNWSICHDGIQDIVSGRFSSEYRFNVIYSGGAFDQGGLTKLVILIFAMELLAVLCYALAVSISHSRWWRVVCIAMVLVLFIAPVGMNLLYSWELARYIAVMGITPKRIGCTCTDNDLFPILETIRYSLFTITSDVFVGKRRAPAKKAVRHLHASRLQLHRRILSKSCRAHRGR